MGWFITSFNIDTAKDILSDKVKGKITTADSKDVVIYDFDFKESTSENRIVGKIISDKCDKFTTWTKYGQACGEFSSSKDLVLLIEEEHKFKPYDRILVPDHYDLSYDSRVFICKLFSHYSGNEKIVDTEGTVYSSSRVLPFEGNEHLVGQPVK